MGRKMMDAATAAAVDAWVADYERDSRGRFTSVPTDADFERLFPPTTYAEADRRFMVAAAQAAEAGRMTDDELYRSIFGDEPEPNRPLPPVERPYARPLGEPLAPGKVAAAAPVGDGLDLSKWAGSRAYS